MLDGAAPVHMPAPAVRAVDATAAGDTFIGALAARLANGETPQQAIAFALRAASVSVTRAGAQPSIPTLDDLQD